jgi:multiple sugar transport system substrate-binding protein
MAPGENALSVRFRASRRSFVKGLGAAGAVLPALAMLPRRSFAEDAGAIYTNAAIDWRQFSGHTITLAGAVHPWSNAITPLLPDFTKLTGINVLTDFQLETTYLGALPIKLARGSSTPDVFMFLTYGQGISAGWLEPLNAHYSDRSLTDLAWYDESGLLKTARAFPVWADGERYAFPITSEAVTLFINSDALAAKNLPVPQTFEELFAAAKAVKTNEMSGIAMRAQAGGNSSPAAMSHVFSYGGHMVKDNKAAFDSPEAIAAVAMFGETLSQAGPVGVGRAAAAALTNLQNADVDRAKAILFHPQSRPIQDAFMIGVNEVVSGAKSAKNAMTAAAEKANAAIRG